MFLVSRHISEVCSHPSSFQNAGSLAETHKKMSSLEVRPVRCIPRFHMQFWRHGIQETKLGFGAVGIGFRAIDLG